MMIAIFSSVGAIWGHAKNVAGPSLIALARKRDHRFKPALNLKIEAVCKLGKNVE
jgi:hypothetical protein